MRSIFGVPLALTVATFATGCTAAPSSPAPATKPSTPGVIRVESAVFAAAEGGIVCEIQGAAPEEAWCAVPTGVTVPRSAVRACGPMDVTYVGLRVVEGRPGWGCGTDVPVEPSPDLTSWASPQATWVRATGYRIPVLQQGSELVAGRVHCRAAIRQVTCSGPAGTFRAGATRVSFHG